MVVLMISINAIYSQSKPLNYYLPDITYNQDIPTPEEVLGFQIGDWHVSHDQILYYMRTIAEKSPRVELTTYAKTHEKRPLIYLTISHPDNLSRVEEIKQQRLQLCDPLSSDEVDISSLPAVIYQGYSIHGNEPSGANAALLNVYYLAAGEGEYIDRLLNECIMLVDPALNPDGVHRFSTWVNMHKNKNMTSDPRDREYNEDWPRGRTNHYWFDLNRDWLLLTHPESRGRLKAFHEWKPDILTDHHEMGTNSTFFFQPGVPSRTNPNTPQKNQILTEEIGYFHAKALDKIGSMYYTKASFDDYYYGKGSTYPDINGGVGILFEQASSRGHLQESVNGLLEFPFTIRNQVVTSLSTQEAGLNLRTQLLEYKRKFFKDAVTEADNSSVKGYIFTDTDQSKLDRYIELLQSHQIKVHEINSNINFGSKTYDGSNSYYVPCQQQQYKLVKTIFEKVTSFPDSLFYDVSTWTLPLAFNLRYNEVTGQNVDIGEEVQLSKRTGSIVGGKSSYAYVFRWDDYYTPAVLFKIQDSGLRTRVIHKAFTATIGNEIQQFAPGSILIPVTNQSKNEDEIHAMLSQLCQEYGIDYYSVESGYGDNDMTLGNPSVSSLEKPNVLLMIGDGVSSYEAGEFWHLLDTRFNIPVTKAEVNDFSPRVLSRYNVLVMSDGNYGGLSESDTKGIEAWINLGGKLLLFRRAINWAKAKNIIKLESKSKNGDNDKYDISYANASPNLGSRVLGGAIFNTEVDLSHPLLYGYHEVNLPVFRRGTSYHEPTKNLYATPVKYTKDARISGYVPRGMENDADGSAVVTVHGKGRGRIIAINDNLNFRGVWWGGSKLVANALFFSSTISGSTVQYDED